MIRLSLKKNVAILLCLILFIGVFVINSYSNAYAYEDATNDCSTQNKDKLTDEEILETISRATFNYFWDTANMDSNSPGYGLVPKGLKDYNINVSSIAGMGHALTAIAIGAERGWVSKEEAYERALITLKTLLDNVEHEDGFFYHFINIKTGTRNTQNVEASTIDATRAISGAIVAGEYFGGEVKELANQIYERVDWSVMRDETYNQFYMGLRNSGYGGRWKNSGEQLALYILSAGSPTHPVNGNMFYNFNRDYGSYGNGTPIINSFFGSMHTYVMSHAWVDFRNKEDRCGINWYENSLTAIKANRQYAIDISKSNGGKFNTYGLDAWGMMAGKGPEKYEGKNGAPPSGRTKPMHETLGTISPSGAAAAMMFTPNEAIVALRNYYENHKNLWGEYGFYDGYNLDVDPVWYADDYSVINVGITLLGIENYRSGFVWKQFMKNPYVQKGIKEVGLLKVEEYPKLLITELMVNSPAEVDAKENFEYIEVYNNSTRYIDLADYNIGYYFTDIYGTLRLTRYPLLSYDTTASTIIKPGKTKVIWIKKRNAGKTLDDFNDLYKVNLRNNDIVVINFPKMATVLNNNFARNITIIKADEKFDNRIVNAFYDGKSDFTNGKSIIYYYPKHDDIIMERLIPKSQNHNPTPGIIEEEQVPQTNVIYPIIKRTLDHVGKIVEDSIDLAWTDPINANYEYVNIYNQDGIKVAGPIEKGNNSKTFTGLTLGKAYFFTITTVNKFNIESKGVRTNVLIPEKVEEAVNN
ncbi:hypothetical protein SH1V18_13890 [Vallitalea longa]|uniref:Glycoamylase-like domain-containing protein n=1 Tax=Vallitalea longa TaxID=2936439 RepID=A0A9W6DFN9_9FIRM|nr:glucoamylase family protein [Vallitalea longa]GKX28909.1 hypothetical protein SH1V18_13890 [Vallitalea longa]